MDDVVVIDGADVISVLAATRGSTALTHGSATLRQMRLSAVWESLCKCSWTF